MERQRQEEEMRIAAQRQAEQETLDLKYNEAIQTADRAFASRVYSRAAEMYREALNLKPQEQYPRTRLAETTRIIDQLNRESQSYAGIIETADAQFNQRQYTEARVSYTRASQMRSNEQYPRQRLAEIDRLLAEELGENVRYQNAVREGDRLFNQRQFFGSRDAYQLALSFRPDDTRSMNRIIEINNIIANSEEMAAFYARGHMDVSNVREMIRNNTEKRYYFVPFEQRRTGSYLMVKTENTSGRNISLFINYGKDNQRSGGFSVTVGSQSGVSELRINISDQVRWISEDNNWISITPVGGEIDLHSIKVHFGR
jgi:tetratricopeptide (TPR) repeat protein